MVGAAALPAGHSTAMGKVLSYGSYFGKRLSDGNRVHEHDMFFVRYKAFGIGIAGNMLMIPASLVLANKMTTSTSHSSRSLFFPGVPGSSMQSSKSSGRPTPLLF